jgi:diguanylate cyclase (GGDEF)-like protein
MININPYAIPPILSCIFILCVSIFVFSRRKKSTTALVLSLFCFSMFLWLLGFSAMYLTNSPELALIRARLGFIGVVFIPVFAFHCILSFLQLLKEKLYKRALIFLYLTVIPVLSLSFTPLAYKSVQKFFWGYYPIAGKFYIVFLLIFVVFFMWGIILLWNEYRHLKNKKTLRAEQLKYLLLGFGFGATGVVDYVIKFESVINYFARFNIEIYPYGYVVAVIFILCVAYAIVKLGLIMEIDLMWRIVLSYVIFGFTGLMLVSGIIILSQYYYVLSFILSIPVIFLIALLYNWLPAQLQPALFSNKYEYLQKAKKILDDTRLLYTIDDLFIHYLNPLKDIMKLQNMTLLVYNKEKDRLEIVKQEGRFNERTVEQKYLNTKDLGIEIFQNTNKPIMKEHLQSLYKNNDMQKSVENIFELFDSEIMCVLEDENKNLSGLLFLGEREKGSFQEPDTEMILLMKSKSEQTIKYEDYIRRENEKQKEEHRRYMNRVAEHMSEYKNLEDLSHFIIDTFLQKLNTSYGAIYLYDDEREVYVLKYAMGKTGERIERNIKKDDALIQLIQTQELILTDVIDEWSKQSKSLIFQKALETIKKIQAQTIVPIILGDMLGFIVAGNKNDGTSYSLDDWKDFYMLSHVTAVTILNVMYSEKMCKDAMTKLYRKEYFEPRLEESLSLGIQKNKKVTCLMFDLDHFKQINDSLGHGKGDEILKKVSKKLRESVRPTDLVFRNGGEEFAIIASDINAEEAYIFGERIRNIIESDEEINATVSIGITTFDPQDKELKLEDIVKIKNKLVHMTDQALYRAKKNGRNQVKINRELKYDEIGKLNILMISKDENINVMYKDYFKSMGHMFNLVDDYKKGIEVLEEENVNGVIIDRDGIQEDVLILIKQISEKTVGSGIAFIGSSFKTEDKHRLVEAGLDEQVEFFVKPVKPMKVSRWIEAMIL